LDIVILSIITINYNGQKDTCELIGTLPLEDKSIEVIVIDNASAQDEATIIKERFPQVKVIRSKENLGFAGGNSSSRQIPVLHQQRHYSQTSDLRPQTSYHSLRVLS
jgi:hypothetical protein